MRTGLVSRSFSLCFVVGALLSACSGSNPLQPFDVITVNVTGTGTGGGTVTASDPAVPTNCTFPGPKCQDHFKDAGSGGVFNLVASPAAGSLFTGWSGCSSSSGNVCTLSFGAFIDDTTFDVTAQFDPAPGGSHPLAEIRVYNGTSDPNVTVTMLTPFDGQRNFGPIAPNTIESDSLQVEAGEEFQITATVGTATGSVTCTTLASIIPDPNDPNNTGNALVAVFMEVGSNPTLSCNGSWD